MSSPPTSAMSAQTTVPSTVSPVRPDTTLGEDIKAFWADFEKVRKRHPAAAGFLFWLSAVIAFFILIRLGAEFAEMFGFGKAQDSPAFWSGTTAIDLIAAFGGIVIGVIITLIFERRSEEQNQALAFTTTSIQRDVKDIVRSALALKSVTEYANVLKEIQAVIQDAETRGNDLYIMNPTAAFGYFLTFDADVLLADAGVTNRISHLPERANALSQMIKPSGYFEYWQKTKFRQRSNYTKLLRAATEERPQSHPKGGGHKKVRYATLSTKPISVEALEPSDQRDAQKSGIAFIPYVVEFAQPGLHEYEVVVFDPSANEFPSEAIKSDKKKLALVPKHQEVLKDDSGPDKAKLVQHLLRQQEEDMKGLGGPNLSGHNTNIEVIPLESVPIQIFLSIPPERHMEGRCLFLFSNRFTIGRTNDIPAFVTQDYEIMEAFRTMFNAIVEKYHDKTT